MDAIWERMEEPASFTFPKNWKLFSLDSFGAKGTPSKQIKLWNPCLKTRSTSNKEKWKRENKQVHSQLWSWVIYICCYHRIGEAVFTAGCVCCSISCLELKLQKAKVVSWNNSPKSSGGKKKGQFGCNWNWQQKVFWDIVWITTLSNSCRTALFCKQTVSEA